MKKLKLAIFAVQAKFEIRRQLFSSSKKSNHGGAPRLLPATRSLAAIRSIMRQTASREALAAIDSIMVSKSRLGPLSLLDELINYPKAKRQHDLLAQTTMPTNSPPPGRYPTAAFNSIHPRTLPPHLAA